MPSTTAPNLWKHFRSILSLGQLYPPPQFPRLFSKLLEGMYKNHMLKREVEVKNTNKSESV